MVVSAVHFYDGKYPGIRDHLVNPLNIEQHAAKEDIKDWKCKGFVLKLYPPYQNFQVFSAEWLGQAREIAVAQWKVHQFHEVLQPQNCLQWM